MYVLTKNDLNQIEEVVERVVDKRLKPVKKDLRYVKKTLDVAIKMFDENDVKLDK